MHGAKKFLFFFFLILIGYGVYFAAIIYLPLSSDGEIRSFVIDEGSGVNEISRNLYDQNFIKDKFVFETYVWLLRSENKIKAGEHLVSKKISIRELTDQLIFGKIVEKEKNITLIEGWTLRNIAEYLEKEQMIEADNFFAITGYPAQIPTESFDFSTQYDFLKSKPTEVSLEGYLYPDTYRIFKDANVNDVIQKSLNNFDQKLTDELRQEIVKQNKSIHEVITLASIIEKEARAEKDKKMIADLFLRRMDVGMPLQADSTVNYIIGGKKPAVSYRETEIDSPYNTYKYKGLPPGPISNPSISSIEAVVYPTSNDYWYFLTTLDDGRVIYSKTNEEHGLNKRKYLK